MKYIEVSAPFISDGIWKGDEFDPCDRNDILYAGLDDDGFRMKSEFVKSKMEDARNGNAGWYDSTTYFVPGEILVFKVADDDDNVIGYCAYNDWNPELQASECENAKTSNMSFAYCDEVKGMNDSEILMFLANRIINAIARCAENGSEIVVPFEESEMRVASCNGFRKCACNVPLSEFDRSIIASRRK